MSHGQKYVLNCHLLRVKLSEPVVKTKFQHPFLQNFFLHNVILYAKSLLCVYDYTKYLKRAKLCLVIHLLDASALYELTYEHWFFFLSSMKFHSICYMNCCVEPTKINMKNHIWRHYCISMCKMMSETQVSMKEIEIEKVEMSWMIILKIKKLNVGFYFIRNSVNWYYANFPKNYLIIRSEQVQNFMIASTLLCLLSFHQMTWN